ncbi:MAG: phosphoribosylaminoimidazolesuccinocarboxamide synthase [Planctomycetota bacterium]
MEFRGKKLPEAVISTQLPFWSKSSGKVRDIYDAGERLFIVASDRISAYDFVLGSGIPLKGKVLTGLSLFWFDFLKDVAPNHLITADITSADERLTEHAELLSGRSMLVKKATVVPIECVVRGYLSGSGWRGYRKDGRVCGIELPEGMKESDKLSEPIFTPATKAAEGHDENITLDKAADIVGRDVAEEIRDKSIAVYEKAAAYALTKGIIIADTKFEFGFADGSIILIDEVLTPDSSRFWPADDYEAGRSQKSFDKQYVRDYLDASGWAHSPPVPALPDEVVVRTLEKYVEAYERVTGGEFTF